MNLCLPCALQGYCQKEATPTLTDKDLAKPNVIRGIRWSAFLKKINTRDWLDFATDLNRDYLGWYVDPTTKREVFIDMDPLEDAPYEWWRDFCNRPCSPLVIPHVRLEAWERVRSLGSILRASYPSEAFWWFHHPANLNRPPRGD